MGRFEGKVAVVTGAAQGIGEAYARALGAEGATVVVADLNQELGQQVAKQIEADGGRAVFVRVDVSDPGSARAMADRAAEELGGVDLLVNNAGGSFGGKLPEATIEDWQRTFDLNLFHAVRCTRAAVPHMRERGGGSVVTIASISGWRPGSTAQYGAAKASEIFLAQALAWELAAERIRVNTVSPGSILWEGGGWDRWREDNPARFERFREHDFPWGRLGTPEEVAAVTVMVLSPKAGWINGANIPVDGGQAWGGVFAS